MSTNKKIILISSLITIGLSVIAFASGYFLSKKKNSVKKIDGELYVDYSENNTTPAIYLSNIDPMIFNNKPNYIILATKHVRK